MIKLKTQIVTKLKKKTFVTKLKNSNCEKEEKNVTKPKKIYL